MNYKKGQEHRKKSKSMWKLLVVISFIIANKEKIKNPHKKFQYQLQLISMRIFILRIKYFNKLYFYY